MWLEQSFCNLPVHREHRFLATRAKELSEKIHELRIDYQTVGAEGRFVKAPGYCSENVRLANPLTSTCTSTRENTSNDLNPILLIGALFITRRLLRHYSLNRARWQKKSIQVFQWQLITLGFHEGCVCPSWMPVSGASIKLCTMSISSITAKWAWLDRLLTFWTIGKEYWHDFCFRRSYLEWNNHCPG